MTTTLSPLCPRSKPRLDQTTSSVLSSLASTYVVKNEQVLVALLVSSIFWTCLDHKLKKVLHLIQGTGNRDKLWVINIFQVRQVSFLKKVGQMSQMVLK